MSEQVSAVSSIADACEFRFARFYIVCEAMTLGDTRKSAHCLQPVGHILWIVKNVAKTQNKCQTRRGRNARIFASRMLHTGLHPELISSPCIYSAVILLPHKDCFPPSGAPGAEYSGNAP